MHPSTSIQTISRTILAGVCMAAALAGRAQTPPPAEVAALRRAIEDLAKTYPAQYTRAPEFLDRLQAASSVQAFDALRREALLANPLLAFDRVIAIRRSGNPGLPANFHSNSSIAKTGYDNTIIEFSISGRTPDRVIYQPTGKRFAGDLCLHFDATRLLFSMPTNNAWQVHEIRVDGGGLRQVTPDMRTGVDNYDAAYLPGGDIFFTSTLCMTSVPCVNGGAHVATPARLYTKTGKVRQLGFDQEHSWSPRVMPDGTVLYQRWEYTDTPHSNTRLLMTMNPDGTNQREFYGSNSYWPAAFFYARPIPGSNTRVIGVSGGHHGDPRLGELYILDASISRREDKGVVAQIPSNPTTPSGKGKIYDHMLNVWPRFLHPFPLSDKYHLVSCQPSPKHAWGVYLVDVFDNFVLLKEQPGAMMFEPVALQAVPEPPVIQERVDPARADAIVQITDIYAGDGLKNIPRGTVKSLRLFTYVFSYHNVGGLLGVLGADGPWDIRRMLGTVPVQPDGSAFFRVPANTPISIQPLDEKGQALQLMRSWTTAMPGENLSCVGCHEDPSMSPPARMPQAMTRAPVDITPWWDASGAGFAFEREVQPVLDRHCVSCHDGAVHALNLRGGIPLTDWSSRFSGNGGKSAGKFSTSYANLFPFVRNNGIEGDYHLLAPMDFHFSATELGQILRKGHHGVDLGDKDFARLVAWADLNRPYHGSWEAIVGTTMEQACAVRAELAREYGGLANPYTEKPPPVVEDRAPVAHKPLPPAPVPGPLPAWAFDPAKARTMQDRPDREITLDLGNGQSLTLVRIPAGEFVMGSADGHRDEQPPHPVRIEKAFWMARAETTNAQFRRFDPAHDSKVATPMAYQFGQRPWSLNGDDQPVCRVSFQQAMAFCEWLSARSGKKVTLPTETQWEWACRAGSAETYSFGPTGSDYTPFANLGDASLSDFASDTAHRSYHGMAKIQNPTRFDDWIPKDATRNDGQQLSAAAGKYAPNAFGLLDMHGNVAEWTRSAYRPYPFRDHAPDAGEEVVARGGSWYDRPTRATSSHRSPYRPFQPVFSVGFRVMVEDAAPEVAGPQH